MHGRSCLGLGSENGFDNRRMQKSLPFAIGQLKLGGLHGNLVQQRDK